MGAFSVFYAARGGKTEIETLEGAKKLFWGGGQFVKNVYFSDNFKIFWGDIHPPTPIGSFTPG